MAPGVLESDDQRSVASPYIPAGKVASQTNGGNGLTAADYMEYEDNYSVNGMPPHRVVIHRALGSYMWDLEGRRYVDFLSAYGSVNQGHCHPRVVAAVVEQCKRLTISGRGVYNEAYSLMCKKLSETLGFERVAATNSGSEAVDFAIRLSRKWGYQKKGIAPDQAWILTASGNYHGRTMTPLSVSTNPNFREDCGPFVPAMGSTISDRVNRFGNIDDLRTIFENDGHRIAAFMMECVQGNAGCLPVPDGYLGQARKLCDEHQILFICDEIQCGLGRSGYLMTPEREGVRPDILLLGKSVTAGTVPMGVVLADNSIMSLMKHGQHGSTFAGNSMACAAAYAAVEVIVQESLPERCLKLGKVLLERLASINSPFVARATGSGFFCSLWLNPDPRGRVTGRRLAALLLERGILTHAYGDKIRISPPLNIDEDELWNCVSIIEKALQDLPNISERIANE
ncbi:ornithine-oxo-acid transaminase [Phialophora macrospora]|uniref:Ornithine aminotransferase n=1 Tax=Phialophora macrospora TaxID=1851006 RepID=A0A0D2FVY1_9EURO|nr:ornithine-oxo-acid transaminase [Phialophora macrospora]